MICIYLVKNVNADEEIHVRIGDGVFGKASEWLCSDLSVKIFLILYLTAYAIKTE